MDGLLQFKGSYLLVIVVIILSVILTFIDSKLTQQETSTANYFKVALLTGSATCAAIYINTMPGRVSEEILTTVPPF